jgi:hypothetical protein
MIEINVDVACRLGPKDFRMTYFWNNSAK